MLQHSLRNLIGSVYYNSYDPLMKLSHLIQQMVYLIFGFHFPVLYSVESGMY